MIESLPGFLSHFTWHAVDSGRAPSAFSPSMHLHSELCAQHSVVGRRRVCSEAVFCPAPDWPLGVRINPTGTPPSIWGPRFISPSGSLHSSFSSPQSSGSWGLTNSLRLSSSYGHMKRLLFPSPWSWVTLWHVLADEMRAEVMPESKSPPPFLYALVISSVDGTSILPVPWVMTTWGRHTRSQGRVAGARNKLHCFKPLRFAVSTSRLTQGEGSLECSPVPSRAEEVRGALEEPRVPSTPGIIYTLLLLHQNGQGLFYEVCCDLRLLLRSRTQGPHILKFPNFFETSIIISHQRLGSQSGKRRGARWSLPTLTPPSIACPSPTSVSGTGLVPWGRMAC